MPFTPARFRDRVDCEVDHVVDGHRSAGLGARQPIGYCNGAASTWRASQTGAPLPHQATVSVGLWRVTLREHPPAVP